jgi:hypothetical protein
VFRGTDTEPATYSVSLVQGWNEYFLWIVVGLHRLLQFFCIRLCFVGHRMCGVFTLFFLLVFTNKLTRFVGFVDVSCRYFSPKNSQHLDGIPDHGAPILLHCFFGVFLLLWS